MFNCPEQEVPTYDLIIWRGSKRYIYPLINRWSLSMRAIFYRRFFSTSVSSIIYNSHIFLDKEYKINPLFFHLRYMQPKVIWAPQILKTEEHKTVKKRLKD